MKIYTKSGDRGHTSLFNGQRVEKTDLRIELLGEIDELNARIGHVISCIEESGLLQSIQGALFIAGSEIANPDIKVEKYNDFDKLTSLLENNMDEMDKILEELTNFILPGGSKEASLIHLCRTQTRKVERLFFLLHRSSEDGMNLTFGKLLNRLSDYLFVLARFVNQNSGEKDIVWKGNQTS